MNSVSSFSGPINGPYVANPSVSHAIICLHGFGSSGDDLFALAPALYASLGNFGESSGGNFGLAVYCPDAPTLTPGDRGRQWFRDMGWTFRDAEGLSRVAVQLDDFIGQVAKLHHISTANIAVLGFSQGAMALLHALPNLKHQPGAVISSCGALTVVPTFPQPPHLRPMLFIHGAEDDVLPADTSVQAATTFSAQGYPTQLEILDGLGHGIDAATVAHISVFLQSVWGARPSQDAA